MLVSLESCGSEEPPRAFVARNVLTSHHVHIEPVAPSGHSAHRTGSLASLGVAGSDEVEDCEAHRSTIVLIIRSRSKNASGLQISQPPGTDLNGRKNLIEPSRHQTSTSFVVR